MTEKTCLSSACGTTGQCQDLPGNLPTPLFNACASKGTVTTNRRHERIFATFKIEVRIRRALLRYLYESRPYVIGHMIPSGDPVVLAVQQLHSSNAQASSIIFNSWLREHLWKPKIVREVTKAVRWYSCWTRYWQHFTITSSPIHRGASRTLNWTPLLSYHL